MTLPRGAACNNPTNLMHNPAIKWQGEIPTTDPEGRLCTFDTMLDGVRAGAIDILSCYYHDGLDTIADILNHFASAKVDNNNTPQYIAFMCQGLGLNEDSALTLSYAPFLCKWIKCQERFEQGGNYATDDDISKGVAEALQHEK